MRTLHLSIALDESSHQKAIETLQGLLDLSFHAQEIAGYRIWICTEEHIDTKRDEICSFLAKNFPDFRGES